MTKRKRVAWNGDAATDAVVQRFGGTDVIAGKFNRLSILAILDVARVARAIESKSDQLSSGAVAAVLLGVMAEADTVPDRRTTEASAARIGSHFGISARVTRRALEALEAAGVIAATHVRGRRLTIQLLDGVDSPQTRSRVNESALAALAKVRPSVASLDGAESKECGQPWPHSRKSAAKRGRTPEKVRPSVATPNIDLKSPQRATDSSVAPELRADSPNSLESDRESEETRARAPKNDGAPPTLDAFEVDPEWFANDSKPPENPESPDQEPELRRGEIPTASEMSSAILTTADRDQLRSLGIEPHLIDGAVASGITSDELKPVLLEAEFASSERFLRRARVAMWIRSTARERGHPITDPEPAPTPKAKPKRKALA